MACVLIVEDDQDVREFMNVLLSNSGYETMCATDGRQALEKMRERRPCVVILDLQMPVMDGWQFREQQLQDAALSGVPVVCVTAYFDPYEVTERLGAPCLLKPADLSEVLHEIQKACGKTPT